MILALGDGRHADAAGWNRALGRRPGRKRPTRGRLSRRRQLGLAIGWSVTISGTISLQFVWTWWGIDCRFDVKLWRRWWWWLLLADAAAGRSADPAASPC